MGQIRAGFTAETAQRILSGPGAVYLDYGLPTERPLGATRGGNAFNPGIEWRDIEVDIPFDNVRGLRRLQAVKPVLTVNLLEQGVENWQAAIPGLAAIAGTQTTSTTLADIIGSGDGTDTVFETNRATVNKSSVVIYSEANNVQVVVPADDYTVFNVGDQGHSGGTKAEVSFTTAPAAGTSLIASYQYDSGSNSSHTVLRMGELNDEHYFSNVAILADVASKVEPAVFILHNALGNLTGEIGLNKNDEGVLALEFMGNFTASDMEQYIRGNKTLQDVVPFEVRWPNE